MSNSDSSPIKRVIYGESNYATIVAKNGYFVDKTAYIAKLEEVSNPVFLRPRRFGKSLFCSLLRYYYDHNYADRFAELFGHTQIGKQPTPNHNKYIVILFNFSVIDVGNDVEEIERSFCRYCNSVLSSLRTSYATLLAGMPEVLMDAPVADNLNHLLAYITSNKLPPLYIIIDEYDNFANQLITSNQDQLYRELTAADGFLKTFFKALKAGREIAAIANVFITGVLPITIDELASAFNVGTFLTLEPGFEAMLGFTQAEVDQLLDDIYRDHAFDPNTRNEVNALIKNNYNGYHFVDPRGEPLYNSTILIYFLRYYTTYREYPKRLIDLNLKVDLAWVRRVTASNPQLTATFVDQLALRNQVGYDDTLLLDTFSLAPFGKKGFLPVILFYLGILSKQDDFHLHFPNITMRQIFTECLNEVHQTF